MHSDGVAKQIAKWVALGALFLLPLTPLIVANGYFFPFITGKAFYLRILIEIAFSAWVVLVFLDKEYRLRFSWIGAAVVGFVVWMFIADAFALNATKAFWSNFERMEGWVLLVHLLALFFVASSLFRVGWKKWRDQHQIRFGAGRAWFLTSLGVAVIISGYALLQMNGAFAIHQGSARIDATLGNSAYLAIYLLFSTFIALWLALTEKYAWLKWTLIAFAVLEAVLLFYTETRGTVIGFVLALALAAFLAAFTAGHKARRLSAAALALILILVGGFYLARNSSFVQGSHVLQRVASISLSDGSTRFTIWNMAWQGVMERPLTGWGQEGFNYVFNKYYDPALYAQEQWFDRAHNAFIDWLTAGGIPAFLLYLSLFGTALVMLWKSSELSRAERIALTAVLVGYAVHNLFVFDNLYSYIYFFAVLALIDSQVSRPVERFEKWPELSAEDGFLYGLPVAAIIALVLVWTINISQMKVASELITALSPSQQGAAGNLATFQDLTAHPPFAIQEIREQIVSFAGQATQSSQVVDADKQKIASFALDEMKKQVAAYPLDAREHLQLSYVYRIIGDGANALTEIQAAIALSPKKEEFYIEKGMVEFDQGNMKAAQSNFGTAYALGPQFSDLAIYAAVGDFAVGDTKSAEKILQDSFGTTVVDSDVLASVYYRTKNWQALLALWKLRASGPNAGAKEMFGLASAYYISGDRANAIATIRNVIAKYPETAADGAAAIKQIEAGK